MSTIETTKYKCFVHLFHYALQILEKYVFKW